MSRYIDANVLIDAIENCSYTTWSKDINRAWWAQAVKVKDNMVECIKNTPTADVVEVRHGRWETVCNATTTASFNWYMHACSACSYSYKTVAPIGYNYCPKCGTKMDVERKVI